MNQPSPHVPGLMRQKASRYALIGTLIAAGAVVLATVLLAVIVYDGLTLDNIIRAHRENIALWFLDALPFAYALWGQYASLGMAKEAGTLVRQRTATLRKELEEARYTTRAKTDFFARMSHELRTPINAIIGMSESLIDAGLPDTHRRSARIIHDSAHDLLTLINDVLDFSRIESGRMELDAVAFDLRETLINAVALLERQAASKDLKLVRLIPPDAPRHVIGDPGRLRQILVNLLGNAVKYTEAGEITLSLRDWSRHGDRGLRLTIEVADTGIGIPRQEQAQLFQPYHTGRGGTRKGSNSTGLGLAITRELVEAMGGEISVDSEPGKGSAFTLTIQLETGQKADTGQGLYTDLEDKRVLLVEPPSANREALAGQMRALGMRVDTESSGARALQRAREAAHKGPAYALLLTDIFLPDEMDGETLGRTLKQDEAIRDICLSVITDTGARGDAKRFNDAGFAGYLTRPIAPESLRELLSRILATRSMTESDRHQMGPVTRWHVERKRRDQLPVLVVDDSDIALEITRNILQRLGWQVATAMTADAAVQMTADNDYALVLTDWQLDDQRGDALIRKLRELPGERGEVPVVVLSAGSDPEARELALQAGASDWLVKPVAREMLQAALARHTDIEPEQPRPDDTGPDSTLPAETPDTRLVEIFLAEAGKRLEDIRKAANTSPPDLETVARHAHAIKGTSQHVGGNKVAELAGSVEEHALHHQHDVLAELPDMEHALESLMADLRRQIGSNKL